MRKCRKCGAIKPFELFVQRDGKPMGACKECKRKYDVEYRKKNWDRLYAQMNAYREGNPELIKEISARSKRKHAGRRNAEWHKRYTLVRFGDRGSFTDEEWNELCEKYSRTCLCCKDPEKPLTKDHVVPLSKGGMNTIDNIQPLCQSCNSRKKDKVIDYRKVV